MKKVLSIMACIALVLVGGISLAACGKSNEKGKWETSSVDALIEYVDSADVASIFQNFTSETEEDGLKMNMKYVIEGNQNVGGATTKSEATFVLSKEKAKEMLDIDSENDVEIKVYIYSQRVQYEGQNLSFVNVYYEYGEEKYKAGSEINSLLEYTELGFVGMLEHSILEEFKDMEEAGALTVQRKKNGNTVAFKLSMLSSEEYTYTPEGGDEEIKYTEKFGQTMEFVFENGVLTTITASKTDITVDEIGNEIEVPDFTPENTSHKVIKANNTIAFPEGIEDWATKN